MKDMIKIIRVAGKARDVFPAIEYLVRKYGGQTRVADIKENKQ